MTYVRPTELEFRAGWFVAVDPGVDKPAAAVFDRGELVSASRVKVPRAVNQIDDEGERARQVAALIEDWARNVAQGTVWGGAMFVVSPVAVVYELPQIYQRRKSKGNPNQLVPLAMIGSSVATGFRARVSSPKPGEWIGGIPKDTKGDPWKSPRGGIIWGRLRAHERERVQATHDAVDATGLGLWALGRLDKVYPGSSRGQPST